MAERIHIDHGSFEAGRRNIRNWKVPQTVKTELHRFLDDLALGKVNKGKRISSSRQLKYLHALRTPLQFFNKSTQRLSVSDIEHFERALASGQLNNQFTGKPYAHGTQVDMRLLLKVFLRWRLGEAKATSLTDWLDTRTRPKTPEFLSESEIEQLYKHCRNAKQKFLIAVLFDSGARAEEFHNIRFEDIYLPEGKESLIRIALKQEYSKTLGRTIALYWKCSPEAVTDYLAERIAAGIKPSDPVFEGTYDTTKKFLRRFGLSVLRRPVHYHLFRHSSATYYATKLNRQELCYRYGWKFSSNMPDTYIARSGMQTKQLDEKFTQTELGAVKADLVQLEQASRIKDDRINQLAQASRTKDDRIKQLERDMEAMRQDMDMFAKVLGLNPKEEDVEAAWQRKMRSAGQ